ncbi:MAG: hypothetical protein QM639_15845 [Rhodocyclaceae bacterium]
MEYAVVIVVCGFGMAYVNWAMEEHTPMLLFANAVAVVCLAGILWRGLWDRRPALKLSAEGIWFRGWRSDAPLPWSAVKRIRCTRGKYNCICFDLKDASDILGRPEFAYVQRWSRVTEQMAGAPFTIGATMLSATPVELMERLTECLERSRRRH